MVGGLDVKAVSRIGKSLEKITKCKCDIGDALDLVATADVVVVDVDDVAGSTWTRDVRLEL